MRGRREPQATMLAFVNLDDPILSLSEGDPERAHSRVLCLAGLLLFHREQHVAQRRHSAIDGRTTRHGGYRLSQRVRKRVEEVFGWVKTVGGGRKLRYRGVRRNQMWAELTVAGYNLVRLAKLAQNPA